VRWKAQTAEKGRNDEQRPQTGHPPTLDPRRRVNTRLLPTPTPWTTNLREFETQTVSNSWYVFFFPFFSFFSLFTNDYFFTSYVYKSTTNTEHPTAFPFVYATVGEMEGSDDKNGPKRRVWRRLGPRWVFIFFSSYFLSLTNVLCPLPAHHNKQLGPNDSKPSFGPLVSVFIFIALLCYYLSLLNYSHHHPRNRQRQGSRRV
jgi:hypothetical protein